MSIKDTPTMIDEAELRTILTTTAERYEVPGSGPDQVRSAIREQAAAPTLEPLLNESWASRVRRTSGGHRTLLAVTGVAAAILLVGLVVVNVGRDSRNAVTASREATPSRPDSALSPNSAPSTQPPPSTTTPAGPSRDGATSGSGLASRQPSSQAGSAAKNATAKDQVGSEKIVKTGSIDLQVPRGTFSDQIARLTSAARGLGGFVAETSTSEQDTTPTGSIALRVPADRFEDLLVQARKLGKVQSATTGAQDVTSEYTDITGRLKTMKQERDSLSLVLTDAKNVPDILAVRDRLNSVQNEIEQLEGRRKVLDDQTALATLTVSLHEKEAPKPASHAAGKQSGLGQAWHDAIDNFNGGIEAIVAGSGKVLLVALCATGLWLLGTPVWRRLRRSLV